jgi:hypothetical protein
MFSGSAGNMFEGWTNGLMASRTSLCVFSIFASCLVCWANASPSASSIYLPAVWFAGLMPLPLHLLYFPAVWFAGLMPLPLHLLYISKLSGLLG